MRYAHLAISPTCQENSSAATVTSWLACHGTHGRALSAVLPRAILLPFRRSPSLARSVRLIARKLVVPLARASWLPGVPAHCLVATILASRSVPSFRGLVICSVSGLGGLVTRSQSGLSRRASALFSRPSSRLARQVPAVAPRAGKSCSGLLPLAAAPPRHSSSWLPAQDNSARACRRSRASLLAISTGAPGARGQLVARASSQS